MKLLPKRLLTLLKSKYKLSELRDIKYFLGIKVIRNRTNKKI